MIDFECRSRLFRTQWIRWGAVAVLNDGIHEFEGVCFSRRLLLCGNDAICWYVRSLETFSRDSFYD